MPRYPILIALLFFGVSSASSTLAVSLRYQGELLDRGQPANGRYDLQLTPFVDANSPRRASEPVVYENVLIEDGLFVLEPDFGTAALTVAVGLSLLFLAGARWRYIVPTLLAVGGLFAVMVALNPNRARRFTAFLDVEGNKMGGTYQLYQALASFAAGGAEGAGLGQGRQQLNFLPEAHTDFIFAVVAEELGLVFTMGVVALFAAIFIAGWVHLRRAPNLFQYLLVAGALLLICLQAIINLGVVTGLFPTKGMSLPFLSAGLSNLILMGLLVGIFINTQRNWGRAVISGEGRKFREVLS